MSGVSIGAAALAAGISASAGGTTAAASAGVGTRRERRAAARAASAHQIEVADLRAAGLNPILSAGGAGASNVQPMSAQDAHMPDISQLPFKREEMRLADKATTAETALKEANVDLTEQLKEKALHETANAAWQNQLMEKQNAMMENAQYLDNLRTKLYKQAPWLTWADKIKEYIPFIDQGTKTFESFGPKFKKKR